MVEESQLNDLIGYRMSSGWSCLIGPLSAVDDLVWCFDWCTACVVVSVRVLLCLRSMDDL